MIHGRSPRDAALESVRTSGRAVQFAAATVIIALLGLFVMRITFFNGIAVAAAITVFMVMVGRAAPAAGRAVAAGHLGVRRADGLDHRRGGDPQAAADGRAARPRQGLPLPRLAAVPAGHPDRAGLAPDRPPRQGARPAPSQRLRALRQLAAAAAVADRRLRAGRHARRRDPHAVAAAGLLRRLGHRPGQPAADRVRPDRRGLRARASTDRSTSPSQLPEPGRPGRRDDPDRRAERRPGRRPRRCRPGRRGRDRRGHPGLRRRPRRRTRRRPTCSSTCARTSSRQPRPTRARRRTSAASRR